MILTVPLSDRWVWNLISSTRIKCLFFKDTSLFTFLWNPQFLNLHKRSSWSSLLSARCMSKVSKQVNSFKKFKYVFLTDVFLTLICFKWEYVHKTVKHIAFLFNFFILLVIFHLQHGFYVWVGECENRIMKLLCNSCWILWDLHGIDDIGHFQGWVGLMFSTNYKSKKFVNPFLLKSFFL